MELPWKGSLIPILAQEAVYSDVASAAITEHGALQNPLPLKADGFHGPLCRDIFQIGKRSDALCWMDGEKIIDEEVHYVSCIPFSAGFLQNQCSRFDKQKTGTTRQEAGLLKCLPEHGQTFELEALAGSP